MGLVSSVDHSFDVVDHDEVLSSFVSLEAAYALFVRRLVLSDHPETLHVSQGGMIWYQGVHRCACALPNKEPLFRSALVDGVLLSPSTHTFKKQS